MTVKKNLVKAKAYMLKHGFCKNTLADRGGRVCALGAINGAIYGNPHSMEGGLDFSRTLVALESAVGVQDIPAWNNHPKRTKQQVLAGFDKAIKAQN